MKTLHVLLLLLLCSLPYWTPSISNQPDERPAGTLPPIRKIEPPPSIELPDLSKLAVSEVVKVTDGDTIRLEIDGKDTTVRLIGVNAPEAAESFGPQAAEFLSNLLAGETVYFEPSERERKTDRYGRTLGYVYRVPDGLFVNAEIVRDGYGRAYTDFAFKHLGTFQQLEERAKRAKKGLWGDQPTRIPAAPATAPTDAPRAPAGQPPTKAEPPQKVPDVQAVTVYKTKTGTKYHRTGCRYLSKSSIPISLNDAKREGLSPCSVCHPPS